MVPDTRQPPYLGVELPGLVAAWEIPGEAYLYLCSNHQRFVDQQAATGGTGGPANFFVDLEAALQQGFEFMLSADPAKGPAEVHATFEERIPKSDEFAPQKLYRTIRIEKQSEPRLAANVYEHAADKIPGGADSRLLTKESGALRIGCASFSRDPASRLHDSEASRDAGNHGVTRGRRWQECVLSEMSMAPESEDNATQHRTVSGKLVVGLMFAFGLLMIGTLYVYWYFHTGPFRPLQEAIARAIPKSSPRVIGGKHKSHQPGSKNRLRIIVQVAYDPRSEEHASERNALAKSILETGEDASRREPVRDH